MKDLKDMTPWEAKKYINANPAVKHALLRLKGYIDSDTADDDTDTVNKPSHYQGKYGMESVEIIDNFVWDLPGKAAWAWGNCIKYLVRFQKKNGLEDLKKAQKNLNWLIEELEKEYDRTKI